MKTTRMLSLLLAAVAACGGCKDSISGAGGGTTAAKPSAPTGLQGVLQNNGKEVALSWVDSSGNETGFRIEVNTGAFGAPPYAGVFFVGANMPGFVYDTTLPNTTYFFRVYAITGSTQSDPSNVVNLTTSNFPLPPFYFSALASGPNSVVLDWVNGPSDTGNIIERSTDNANWSTIFNGATGPNVQGFTDVVGFPNTVYYYRGYAVSGLGTSSVSQVASTRTQSTPGGMTTVPSTSGFGANTALAFGPSANQNIVSYDFWFASLVITRGGFPGPYTTTTIDTGQGNGYYGTGVATDDAGNVFVASHIYGTDELRFVTNQTGPWTASTIDFDPSFSPTITGVSPEIRVAPAPAETIHIVYKVENPPMGDGFIRHAWRAHAAGSPWNSEDVLGYTAVLKGHSFEIDSAGTLHLIYATQNLGDGIYELRHAWNSGSGWNDELVVAGGQPDMNSVAVGAANRLHVAYKDVSTGALRYATNRTGPWTTEEVHYHTTGNLGRYNSILFFPTPSADVHISYYDAPNKNLWYAGKNGTAGAWNRKLIDSAGEVGQYTSIGADGTDIYISYYLNDSMNPRLKIVRNPQD